MPKSVRDRLLDTAGILFYRHGFKAVGIDRILEEAGVAKMTMYKHFRSKDGLIAAYLARADSQFWEWAETATRSAATPEQKLLTFFEAVEQLATSPECLGCVFQSAAMAFPEFEHPGHVEAVAHKIKVRKWLFELADEANLRDPEGLAQQLSVLLDGAWIAARTFGAQNNPAVQVARAARSLIEAHRSGSKK